jgi:hypothetical protein
VAVLVGLVAVLAPARALAAPSDVTATHAYIQANYALAKASVGLIDAGQAKIQRFNAQLGRECPDVGAGSLEDEAGEPMSYVVAVALWSIAYGTDAGAIRTFAQVVGHLHWNNRRIARLAERYASSLQAYAALPLPDLCAEVGSWKATGFQTIPPVVAALDAREQAIDATALPAGLVAPYERGNDAAVLARTEGLEIKLEENEFLVGQGDWYEVLATLGVKP